MDNLIPRPDPGVLEGELAREFAPLRHQGCLVLPGAAGQATLQRFAHVVGAAATRCGKHIEGERSAENFLLAQTPPASDRPPRLVAAVCEGNYKAPITVIGGTIALSELHRHVVGASAGDTVEDGVRLALVATLQRFHQINRLDPPHLLTRWSTSSTSAAPAISGLMTSFTALIVEGHEVLLAHIGECHAYRVAAPSRSLLRLSADHAVAADPQFARYTKESSWFATLGDIPHCVLGAGELADIQIEWFALDPGDTLLVCSSSVRKGQLGDDALVQLLLASEPEKACEELVSLAALDEHPHCSATVVVLRPS